MKKQVYIVPKSISTEEKQIGFPEDTSFWKPLWSKLSRKAAMMEIHCWAEETEVRAQLGARMKEIGKVFGTETIAFKVELTEDSSDWMATQSYDARGGLKWFSIFLFDSLGEKVSLIEHYGGEIVFYPNDDVEAEEVKSFFKGEISFTIYPALTGSKTPTD